jgi:hypothetical protein
MQDMAGSYPQLDSRNDNYFSIVSDLMSLATHIQASMNMLETAIARELPAGDPDAYENIVVLDDVTPCYVKANAALHACKAGLEAALHCMLDIEMRNMERTGLPDANATRQIWRIAPNGGKLRRRRPAA